MESHRWDVVPSNSTSNQQATPWMLQAAPARTRGLQPPHDLGEATQGVCPSDQTRTLQDICSAPMGKLKGMLMSCRSASDVLAKSRVWQAIPETRHLGSMASTTTCTAPTQTLQGMFRLAIPTFAELGVHACWPDLGEVAVEGGLKEAGQVYAKEGALLPEGGLVGHLSEQHVVAEGRAVYPPDLLGAIQQECLSALVTVSWIWE